MRWFWIIVNTLLVFGTGGAWLAVILVWYLITRARRHA